MGKRVPDTAPREPAGTLLIYIGYAWLTNSITRLGVVRVLVLRRRQPERSI
ncbi:MULTISPECIES: hypothetical protein [Streptomyces]|uniref:hypothetical protein n=1 Tax=Streptomyces TaxID=1883 RepID=UPI00131A808A|nr:MULTISPECIES: hypothetical protein [Streptomyces]